MTQQHNKPSISQINTLIPENVQKKYTDIQEEIEDKLAPFLYEVNDKNTRIEIKRILESILKKELSDTTTYKEEYHGQMRFIYTNDPSTSILIN